MVTALDEGCIRCGMGHTTSEVAVMGHKTRITGPRIRIIDLMTINNIIMVPNGPLYTIVKIQIKSGKGGMHGIRLRNVVARTREC